MKCCIVGRVLRKFRNNNILSTQTFVRVSRQKDGPPFSDLSSAPLQRHNGEILTTASVKHLSHRRFVVSFQRDNVQRTDQDLYRCVTQSSRGSGVSNFAELIVKGNHSHFTLSCCPLLVCFFSL